MTLVPCGRFRAAFSGLALLACLALTAFYAQVSNTPGLDVAYVDAASAAPRPPTTAEFADSLMGTANAYALTHGKRERVQSAHCVQGAVAGHYMCAYVVRRASGATECHLMQAEWRPGTVDSYVVTLSGRARRCNSVRAAVRSLD
jgi:hypothetical protein